MTRADVEYIADKAGVRFVLVDSELEHLVSFLKLPRVVCSDREGDEYERFLAEQPGTWHDLELAGDENDTMSISFTSGTTSRPKGVESSLRGVYLAAIANNVETKMDDKAVYLWLLPMFHMCTHPLALVFSVADSGAAASGGLSRTLVSLSARQGCLSPLTFESRHDGHVHADLPAWRRHLRRCLGLPLEPWRHALLWRADRPALDHVPQAG